MSQRVPIDEQKIRVLQGEIRPFAETFDLIKDHVVITDENANIIYANKSALLKTRFSREDMIGKNPGDLWGGNMPKEFFENMWRRIKISKQPFSGEVRNVTKTGDEYWQQLQIFPVLDDLGNIKFFIGIEPDISARKSAEAEERKQWEEVDKLNKYMIGRELKMIELKKEVEQLKARLRELGSAMGSADSAS